MGVVIDTSVWIALQRRELPPETVSEAVAGERMYIAPAVWAELKYGVERAPTEAIQKRRQTLLAEIGRLPFLTTEALTAEIFAKTAALLDRMGRPATHRVHDVWIAATAIQHGFAVVTRNAADFEDIPSLRVIVV